MTNPQKRLLAEIAVVLVLVLALYGVWRTKDRQREEALAAQAAEWEARLAAARDETEAWTRSLATSEAEAVFRAFFGGVQPAVLAADLRAVDRAVNELLKLPGVAFVHVLKPDGTVLASSDRKWVITGQAGPEAAWALATWEVTARPGPTAGTTELAAPVLGPSNPQAFVWMGYETDKVRQAAHP